MPCDEGGHQRIALLFDLVRCSTLSFESHAAVAQWIRALVYGTKGRGFESLSPHQFISLGANRVSDRGHETLIL